MRWFIFFIAFFVLIVSENRAATVEEDPRFDILGPRFPERLVELRDFLKTTIRDSVTPEHFQGRVKTHFRRTHLLRENLWSHPALECVSERLLSSGSSDYCCQLVDDMVDGIQQNPYLRLAIETLPPEAVKHLKEKALKDGPKAIPEFMSLVSFNEALSRSMSKDRHVLRVTNALWEKNRPSFWTPWRWSINHFGFIKYASIRPLAALLVESKETGYIHPQAFSYSLPINILEATFGDFVMGNYNNARAGWILARHRPGYKNALGADVTRMDKRFSDEILPMAHVTCPSTKQWVDLYQLWNMGFVSQNIDALKVSSKLWMPFVAQNGRYAATSYIERRVFGLWTLLNTLVHQESITSAEEELLQASMQGWNHPALTHHLGRVSALAAQHYRDSLESL